MYWLPYSSHTSHHPSQTPCLSCISYATQKLMLDSCKMVEKQSEVFHMFLWHFFQVQNTILLHIVLLKCPHVQIALLKFTSCDTQTLVGCIPIATVAVHLKQSSYKIYCNNIVNFQESTTILNACAQKCGSLLKAPRINKLLTHLHFCWCPCSVMVKELDCRIVVFELQSRYDFHFRTNTLGKVMNPLILPAMG